MPSQTAEPRWRAGGASGGGGGRAAPPGGGRAARGRAAQPVVQPLSLPIEQLRQAQVRGGGGPRGSASSRVLMRVTSDAIRRVDSALRKQGGGRTP